MHAGGTRPDQAWSEIQKALNITTLSQDQIDSLIFGVFISLNILVWVLIQGRRIGRWASKLMGPVPPRVAYDIFASTLVGPSKAIPVLIIVIISNGYLQTVVSPSALGSALKLHPLAGPFGEAAAEKMRPATPDAGPPGLSAGPGAGPHAGQADAAPA